MVRIQPHPGPRGRERVHGGPDRRQPRRFLVNQGRLDEAEEVLHDAIRVLRASGAVLFLGEGEVQLARAQIQLGALADAEETARRAQARFEQIGSPASALEAALVRADAVTRAGRPGEALKTVAEAERSARADATCRCRAPAPAGPRPGRPGTAGRGR